MRVSDQNQFSDIGPEWSRPRKLPRVLSQLGHEVPERLSRKRFEALVNELDRHDIEMGTADGKVLSPETGSVSIHSKVRLRRKKGGGKPPTTGPRRTQGQAREPGSDASLSAIRIGNFKSFVDAELPLSELTLLIGANASGKSNALEALQLLAWLAGGQRLSQLPFDVKDGKLGLRGRPSNLPHTGHESEPVRLACSVAPDSAGRSLELAVHLRVDRDGLRVAHEELFSPEESSSFPLYRVAEPAPAHGREMQVEYNNFARGGIKPKLACVDEMPVFTQLTSPARFGSGHAQSQKVIPRATRRVSEALSRVLFLDPDPRRMRGYTHRSETTLGGDGTNLSGVLYRLTAINGQKQAVLDFIRALPEQNILDIGYVTTPRDEVMVKLTESFGGKRHDTDAELLSDGTLRVLAIAAALLSVPSGALVVIEEIDNGVHPSRADQLMGRIRQIAAARQLRVLLTTHNPALLDSVPTSALPHVVTAFRDPEDGQSRLVRLEDLPTYPELVARGPLGQLVTRGVLDRFVKHIPTEEERRARDLQWFEESFGEVGS